MTTKKVWYRGSEGSKIEDRGTLTIAGGSIEFVGKTGTIGGPVRAARKRPSGFTNWVLISYEAGGETHDAYFVCSQLLGWVGVLGANKELLEAAEAEIADRS